MKGKNNFVLSQVEKRNVFKDEAQTFKILVASDNHVGFKENDPIRGNDSFEAFEEVLRVAKKENVDFLLLGGDLFHETNPSQQCLYKMLNLLGNHVLGDGEITYEMPNYQANFQDSNLNIELPIFVIHGNHDYPSDEYGNLSVIDLLHATKYLNHFGKFSNIETIKVIPIIFQKGDTVIALYGVGYLKDKYFHKMLEDEKIEFVKPSELGYEKTVNILVIHQNRYKGIKFGQSYRNCVHPEQFPNWMDLIIRGHEHEQLDEVGTMRDCPIVTIQPGSTILTAMEEVQAIPRRAILFEIKGVEANFQDITLIKSYRPVLYENIEMISLLKKVGFNISEETPTDQQAEEILWLHIQQSVKNFRLALKENFPDNPHLLEKKPQLRFKIEHSGIDIFNFQKIETQLSDFVANPGDVLKFWKRVIINQRSIKNPKLDEDFIKTLKGKSDFDTIGNDTVKDIKELYEERIKKNKNISCLPTSLIINTVEKVNLRNRNSQIEDIIKDLQIKLQGNVAPNEEEEIKKINQRYKQQMNSLIQKIQVNIDGKSKLNVDKIPNNGDKIIYRTLMNNQFDEMKQNVVFKIRSKVVELFTQDFQGSDENNQDHLNPQDHQMEDENQEEDEDYQTSNQKMKSKQSKSKMGRQKIEVGKGFQKYRKDQMEDFYEEQDGEGEEENNERTIISNGNKIGKDKQLKNIQKLSKEECNKTKKIKKEFLQLNECNDKFVGEEEQVNEDKYHIQSQIKIGKVKNYSDQIEVKNECVRTDRKSAFKKKATYGDLFNKERQSDGEMEFENMNLSDNESYLSDCEFGFDEKSTKRINYNIAHISQVQKEKVITPSSAVATTTLNNQKLANIPTIANKLELRSDYKLSLPTKKKPQPPHSEETQFDKSVDIRNFMKKNVAFLNSKN